MVCGIRYSEYNELYNRKNELEDYLKDMHIAAVDVDRYSDELKLIKTELYLRDENLPYYKCAYYGTDCTCMEMKNQCIKDTSTESLQKCQRLRAAYIQQVRKTATLNSNVKT